MARSRFSTLIAYASAALLSIVASLASSAQAVVAFVREVISDAFPATVPRELQPVAAAPRVTGLYEFRSFRQELFDHASQRRRRAPMSHAFAAAA